MTAGCPFCGGASGRAITVDLNSNSAVIDGEFVNLRPREAELLYLFSQNTGKTFDVLDVFNRVWGLDAKAKPRIVTTMLAYLNRKIRPLGYEVSGRKGPSGGAGTRYALKKLNNALNMVPKSGVGAFTSVTTLGIGQAL